MRVTPLLAAGHSKLGEGPVWDPRLARLYWVDITAGHLHWLDHGAAERGTLALPGPVGFVSLTDEPQIVVVGCGTRILAVQLPLGRTDVLAELASPDSVVRCNDGKCYPTGRLWAWTMPLAEKSLGALFSLDAGLNLRRHSEDIGCANGLAWHAARREFYFIDSLTQRVDRHRWDPVTGEISDARPLAFFEKNHALPDGMCVDAEGHLWVAFWNGACIKRVDGSTGRILTKIDLPAALVTSCCFGGANLDTLFVTTAVEGLGEAECAAQPLAGRVFTVEPGVRGVPQSYFHLARQFA